MKATSTLWPLLAIVAGALLIRRKQSGVGYMPGYNPADLYSLQDAKDFKSYLEAGYGKGFTEAELEPWERNRWAMLQVAEDEHRKRLQQTKAMVKQIQRERKQASARAALDDYVKYLNHRYGAGWHPGLINPQDSELYYKLLEEAEA